MSMEQLGISLALLELDSHPRIALLGLDAQPLIVDVTNMARRESAEQEPEIEEPHYLCLICEERIPVFESRHRRECSKSALNIKCPICEHPRRDHLIEEHIKLCCRTMRISPAETEKQLNTFLTSIPYIEHHVVKLREELFEGYKKALHEGNELPLFPCLVCDKFEEHFDDATCLRQIGGGELRWRIQVWLDKNMVPRFEKYLSIVKAENQRKILEKYEHRLQNAEARERVMQRAARKSEVLKEKIKAEKQKEVDRLVSREVRLVGTKMRNYQSFFVNNVYM